MRSILIVLITFLAAAMTAVVGADADSEHNQSIKVRDATGHLVELQTTPIIAFHRSDAQDLVQAMQNTMRRYDAQCHALAIRAVACEVDGGREVYIYSEQDSPAHPSMLFRGLVAGNTGELELRQAASSAAEDDAAAMAFFRSIRIWPRTTNID